MTSEQQRRAAEAALSSQTVADVTLPAYSWPSILYADVSAFLKPAIHKCPPFAAVVLSRLDGGGLGGMPCPDSAVAVDTF